MPSLYQLNPPPHPLFDFISNFENHPWFAARGFPAAYASASAAEAEEEKASSSEPQDKTPAESSDKTKGKNMVVEDPPEVDPSTIKPQDKSKKGCEGREVPFRGRGGWAPFFDDDTDEPRRKHPCRGRHGWGHRGGRSTDEPREPPFMFGQPHRRGDFDEEARGPPPFLPFGPWGAWWAPRGFPMDDFEHGLPRGGPEGAHPPPPPPAGRHPRGPPPPGSHGPPPPPGQFSHGPPPPPGPHGPPPPPTGPHGAHGHHRGGPPSPPPGFHGRGPAPPPPRHPHGHHGHHGHGPDGPDGPPGPHPRGPPPHHRRRRGGPPGGFDIPPFLKHLGERFGFDLSDAAAGLDRFRSPQGNGDRDFEPLADIFDTKENYVIHVSLPGAKKEDVGVDWDSEKSHVRIAGVVHRPGVDEEMMSKLVVDGRKREMGAFEKIVRLGTKNEPASIDVAGITAKMTDGVLVVKVPKVPVDHQRREVPIDQSAHPSPVHEAEKDLLFDADDAMYDDVPSAVNTKDVEMSEHSSHTPSQPNKDAELDSKTLYTADDRSETVDHEERLPYYPPPVRHEEVDDDDDEESDWEKAGSDEEGEYVKINVD